MRRINKALKVICISAMAPFVILVIVALWLVYLAKTRQPDLERVLRLPGLQAEVCAIRDDWGVPHIDADNEPDAYFALGYVMGQDRLFQMEIMRRLARGELAELFGPPVTSIDRIVRTFRLRRRAEEYVANHLDHFPEIRAAAEAFIAGINHSMATEPLPFEFTVLHIQPRAFALTDCLAVAALLPISFADGLREDTLASMLKERHPEMDIDALFPGYSKEIPATIMENLDEARAYLQEHSPKQPAGPETAADYAKALSSCALILEELLAVTRAAGPTRGSNCWVLAPSKTASGKPILANDPHVAFTNPGVWYEAHLRFGEFENYGHYLPLIPFALLGHNSDRAWGMTMFANDDIDLFRETFAPNDPNKVMYRGECVDVKTETDTIKVRFGRDSHYLVRITPHGPVITDLYRSLFDYDGPDIALSWVWQNVEYTDLVAFYRIGHARDYESFAAAVALITSPGINVSYADQEGNIAWWAAGKIPIRPDHVNPKMLLDGASGNDEVLGYVPFDQNPHLKNPPCGYIVTANNMSTVKPVGPIRQLQGYWQPGDRAARLEELLEQGQAWTIEQLKTVQFDDRAYAAPAIVKEVLGLLNDRDYSFTALEQVALQTLNQWDFRHDAGSRGAAIYQTLCPFILQHALLDEMGERLFTIYGSVADHWNFFKYFIREDLSPFWDDIETPVKETRREVVLRAFQDTVAKLNAALGPNPAQWTWGALHTVEFQHPYGYVPFVRRIFNIGPFPSSGAAEVINNMLYLGGSHDFRVIAGPSTRRLIDYGDLEHALCVLPTGNSGNFASPHYDDQAEMFMRGAYREVRFSPEQIKAHRVHEMRFEPAR